jgi:Peptidase M16 inactive domain
VSALRVLRVAQQYAERNTIGLESIIRKVPADVVRAFYERWYHPAHMALVVVGDFDDPDAVVAMLRQHMEPLRGATDVAPAIPRWLQDSCAAACLPLLLPLDRSCAWVAVLSQAPLAQVFLFCGRGG